MFSQAHEHSSKLFLLSGLGKGSGTWTRISQLWKLRYLLFWGATAPNLTARHNHNLSEAQVLLKKGFSVIKTSPKSCGFKDFVLSTKKKKKKVSQRDFQMGSASKKAGNRRKKRSPPCACWWMFPLWVCNEKWGIYSLSHLLSQVLCLPLNGILHVER